MNYPKLPSFRLDGKRALVTGAGRGIGMGASIALAESGANVTLISRTEKELKDLTDHINNRGYKASFEVLDVSREDEVSNFINNNAPFDILINNAGIIPSQSCSTIVHSCFKIAQSSLAKSTSNPIKLPEESFAFHGG